MDFPQYRKYKNIETYFKIISEKEFVEIIVMGTKYLKHQIKATQYPEMLRIQDMLNCEGNSWGIIKQDEYIEKELLAQ